MRLKTSKIMLAFFAASFLAVVLLLLNNSAERGGVTLYVAAARPDDLGDGRGWASAKQSIQAAIDIARSGDAIIVSNGVYRAIRTKGRKLRICSVNGPAYTIIDGEGTNRCVLLSGELEYAVQLRIFGEVQKVWYYYLPTMIPSMGAERGRSKRTNNSSRQSVLDGLTLRNGCAEVGGGAYGGYLTNCVLSWNEAELAGGGAWGSSLENCVLRFNRSNWLGGGSWGGSLTSCLLELNVAESGGGSWGGQLKDCRIERNNGECGGGVAAGLLEDCELFSNVGWKIGSAAYGGWLERCTLVGNVMKNSLVTNIVAHASSLRECDSVRKAASKPVEQPPLQTWYVDAQNLDDSGDGLTWQTAKRSIQAAVDACALGEVVMVANGVYEPIVSNNKAVIIQSMNGADSTQIDGRGRFRCATLGMEIPGLGQTNTVLRGFFLINGRAPVCGGTVENCEIR